MMQYIFRLFNRIKIRIQCELKGHVYLIDMFKPKGEAYGVQCIYCQKIKRYKRHLWTRND